jgi:H+/Cl- antiporter ClcA
MAATFNTPIAGVILAIELLLFEFRARSFIPLVIASTLATSVRALLLGQRSMFTMSNANFEPLRGLPFYQENNPTNAVEIDAFQLRATVRTGV